MSWFSVRGGRCNKGAFTNSIRSVHLQLAWLCLFFHFFIILFLWFVFILKINISWASWLFGEKRIPFGFIEVELYASKTHECYWADIMLHTMTIRATGDGGMRDMVTNPRSPRAYSSCSTPLTEQGGLFLTNSSSPWHLGRAFWNYGTVVPWITRSKASSFQGMISLTRSLIKGQKACEDLMI